MDDHAAGDQEPITSREATSREATAPSPFLLVIVGGTGDLTRRKLLPGLYRLLHRSDVGGSLAVLGVARRAIDDARYRTMMVEALAERDLPRGEVSAWAEAHLFYQSLPGGSADEYRVLAERIDELDRTFGLGGNRVIYLSIPPDVFDDTILGLGQAGLNHSAGWTRIVIEKPFGRDLESAGRLNTLVHQWFDESQIYRIDHYLGKETVQNLLAFRFANPLFESVWTRDRVERVEIIVAEDLGVEGRAEYYESAGALRDMIQNHLTQLFTLVAMEIPARMDAEAIRSEKVKVLRSVEPIAAEDVVLGQYASGAIGGKPVRGYREEEEIAFDSDVATFAALKLHVGNWRWQGVPFVLRTGKRLPRRLTQIAVVFRRPPVRLFASADCAEVHPNVLLITIQPDEGFYLGFDVKVPGDRYVLGRQYLHFSYGDAFGDLREAYETLLAEIILGDQTLFVHAEEAEASWALYTPLLENPGVPRAYVAGTWGPPSADALLALTEDDYMLPRISDDEVMRS